MIDVYALRNSLKRLINLEELDFHFQGFCWWASNKIYPTLPVIASKRNEALKEEHILSYKETAFLGYLLDIGNDDTTLIKKFEEGLNRLKGRSFFLAGQPQTIELDRISQLGIVLGIKKIDSKTDLNWFYDTIIYPSQKSSTDEFDESLLHLCMAILEKDRPENISHPIVKLLSEIKEISSPDINVHQGAIQIITSLEDWPDQAYKLITYLVVFDWLISKTVTALPNKASVEEVLQILERINDSMRHWRWEEKASTRGADIVKWHINNEYHVQSLIGLILEPIFYDLEDEEFLKSVGQTQPRTDFGIPSLSLVIEVKFMRDGTQSELAKIINEIGADRSIYLRNGSSYNKMIVFIWDNSSSTDQHQELKDGINAMDGIIGTVIVPRPGRMK